VTFGLRFYCTRIHNCDFTASTSSRAPRPVPEEAALQCRSGMMALKGNLPEQASLSFRQALALNPVLWEAFEGLCALGLSICHYSISASNLRCVNTSGSIPEINELFPPRPPPVKRAPPDEAQSRSAAPTTTGAGFFTPDTANSGHLTRGWKHDGSQSQPFRMGLPAETRDST
jgi:anaphase-promoting complex subunit 3